MLSTQGTRLIAGLYSLQLTATVMLCTPAVEEDVVCVCTCGDTVTPIEKPQ